MNAVLSRCVVPTCCVLASSDEVYQRLGSSTLVFSKETGQGLRLVPFPVLVEKGSSEPKDINASELIAESRKEKGAQYFADFVERLVGATSSVSASLRTCETFGHPVACILAVGDDHPSPIGALTQLYQQSFQSLPWFISPEFLRCAVYVRMPKSSENETKAESFGNVANEFGPHCYELPLETEFTQLAEKIADNSVKPYVERVVKHWQNAGSRSANGASTSSGIGKFFKKLVSSGPPKPETDVFLEVCREMQPHVASIPAPRKHATPFEPDVQLRRLADCAFVLQDWHLAKLAYDALRKPTSAEQRWDAFGAVCEMSGLCASLQLANSAKSADSRHGNTLAQFVTTAMDQALYTYYSRVRLPVYSLRCVLLVCSSLCDAGHALLAAGVLSTALVELSPVPCEGPAPAETAVLMDRVATAFGSHGWQRKTELWNKLAAIEWGRAELA